MANNGFQLDIQLSFAFLHLLLQGNSLWNLPCKCLFERAELFLNQSRSIGPPNKHTLLLRNFGFLVFRNLSIRIFIFLLLFDKNVLRSVFSLAFFLVVFRPHLSELLTLLLFQGSHRFGRMLLYFPLFKPHHFQLLLKTCNTSVIFFLKCPSVRVIIVDVKDVVFPVINVSLWWFK